MSTTFGILRKNKEITDWLTEETQDVFIEIAHRHGIGKGKVDFMILNQVFYTLPDDLKVYPIDNTSQGIFTIGDIRNNKRT